MLTNEDKQVLINIISQTKFTPQDWENVVKNIVIKLQEKDEQQQETKK